MCVKWRCVFEVEVFVRRRSDFEKEYAPVTRIADTEHFDILPGRG